MDQLTERMARLSPEKRALLMKRLMERPSGDAGREPAKLATMDGDKPLSFAQQRLWFIDQLEPNDTRYNNFAAFLIRGDLRMDALSSAINEIVRRHEILRTVFTVRDGRPIQTILRTLTIPTSAVDLRDLPPERRQEAAERRIREEARVPFDLAKGPLLRVSAFDLGENRQTGAREHIVTFALHHIVSDGWSTDILIREFAELYGAFALRGSSPLPELPVQYADYAAWQRDWFERGALDRQLAYWREQLAGAPAAIDLPTDRPRPATRDHSGATCRFDVSRELADGLRHLGRREGTTLFVVLLGAFYVLLSRYSGQMDVCVGTAVANRRRAEFEGLIGFFVNTLVLRANLGGNPRFCELLARLRETALRAQEHQDLPFERLVEEMQPVRDKSRTPLFDTMFVLQNAPTRKLILPALEVERLATATPDAKFDLTLTLEERESGLGVEIEYATALFDAPTIQRMAEHYSNILEAIVTRPDIHIDRLRLSGHAERQRLLTEWNDTAVDYPRDKCIHRLFEEQVARTPDATAIVFGGECISYGELNSRADLLAHRLRHLGVGPETIVGVCVERSFEMVVGVLAVLKAGGAYLPLDPEYPAERLAYMIGDAAAVLVLTRERLRNHLPVAITTIALDSDRATTDEKDVAAPDSGVVPENAAYVIYTSGSTGKPKGAVIAHRNTVALLQWAYGQFGDGRVEAIGAATSLNFDLSVFELFLPLCYGLKLLLLTDIGEAAGLVDHGNVLLNTVPSVMSEALWLDRIPARAKVVNLAGEPLARSLVDAIKRRGGIERVFNLYGPTECTTYSSYASIDLDQRDNPPIGRPIANTRIYLLGTDFEPVPLGAAGEVHIAGAGVARGYLRRPDLTAERFIPDPFEPGERLYRTGDLARYRSDGNIEFLGRIDQQVKIRGFRIELGEVEAALKRVSGVAEAVVAAREDIPGEKRLVAYVVAKNGVVHSDARLRDALRHALPHYMIPSAFVTIDSLPLTKNGKIDRKALPAPDIGAEIARRYIAPTTPIEAALCASWADVLGLERVGADDNFFDLGGHSLLAVRLIEQLRRAGLQTDVRTLFDHPTPLSLAAEIGNGQDIRVPPTLIDDGCTAITPDMLPLATLTQTEIDRIVDGVPGGTANVQDIYPLAPLQEGVFFHHLIATEGDPYLLTNLLRFDSRERLDRFVEAMRIAVVRHDILRTSIAWEGLSAPVQVVWRDAALIVEEVHIDDRSADVGEHLLARFDTRRLRLDVRQAPLLRCFVAPDRTENRWLLLLLAHHLAFDHMTLQSLVEETTAHLSGRTEALLAPTPFRNFIAQSISAVSQDEHRAFFSEMLGDIIEPTAPFGLADAYSDGDVSEARTTLDMRLARRLRGCARGLRVSTASLCHLAFAIMLARISGRADVAFGTVLFGRMHGGAGADRGLGPFINTLPLRLRIGENGGAASARRNHELLTTLLRHEHASLALAQRCSRIAAPAPLFAAVLNYRHSPISLGASHVLSQGVEIIAARERTNYPLALSIDDFGEGFGLVAQTHAPIRPEAICAYMEVALAELTRALEQDPEAPISALDILPEAERRQIVVEDNETGKEFSRYACLHEMFEAQAARTPDAIALTFADDRLTYRELNARANRLAHRLVELGVGPETVVGVCGERSLELVAGLIGVLKAGGAYLPMDPENPDERLAYLIDDARPMLILAHERFRTRLPKAVAIFSLEEIGASKDEWSDRDPGRRATAENLAYVIYTSGSTGRPKGVAVAHRGVVNRLQWMQARYSLTEVDCVLQKTPFGFDVSVWEFFWPLTVGARLTLASPDDHRDPRRLNEVIERERVTTLHFVPSMLQTFLNATEARALDGVRRVLCSGEELSAALARQFLEQQTPQLHNLYGPTEASIDVTAHECASASNDTRVPIGRPIWNTQIYLLDDCLRPTPSGAAGELYIGGVGLARGYLRRPDLTAERFIPNPFGAPGERLYRTGDLARRRPDGDIEYLGRLDDQVKIRGLRIELAEVEVALSKLDAIGQVAIVAREDAAGDKRLVAYVVGRDGVKPSWADVRAALLHELPEYMIPSTFVAIDALPLTANGKVDRKALPAPDAEAASRRRHIGPRTATEEALCRIWAEVLGLETVGVEDNFFELGGHSLKAIQVISRIWRDLGVSLPMSAFYGADALSAVADSVDIIRGLECLDLLRNASSPSKIEEFDI